MLQPYLHARDNAQAIKNEVIAFKEKVGVYHSVTPQEPPEKEYTVLPELRKLMEDYNNDIYENGQENLVDAFAYETPAIDLTEYGIENGVVGLVTIPDINVELPLYLGANYDNLANGFAQLSETSMPIGGESTNCVMACHRGWYGMPYLRDVEMMEIGDPVYIQNPWETLEYRVSEIKVIAPYEITNILIQEGKDLVTLVTCHPYASGGLQRYLVFCERYMAEEEIEIPEPKGFWTWEWNDSVTVTTSRYVEFESSSALIFIDVYLPWIMVGLIILIAVLVSSYLAIAIYQKKKASISKTE